MAVRHHRQLVVWQRAMQLARESYALCDALPATERFGLSAQIRRCAVSVPANVAEGFGRLHRGDFVRHLSIALGSVRELQTHLDIAGMVGHLAPRDLASAYELAEEVGRMLSALIGRLRA